MKKLIALSLLLILPQVASAKVYMCTDPATGKTSFTDRACEAEAPGEEVRVDTTNLDSGSRYGKKAKKQTWVSDRETRKSGIDYNAERRALYSTQTTASTN